MILNSEKIDNSDGSYEEGLKSYYKMSDPSYSVGFNLNFQSKRFLLRSYCSLGLFKLNAYGNWNLRGDLQHPKSYVQTGRGSILTTGGGTDFKISSTWKLFLDYDYQYQKLKNGEDKLYKTNNTVATTRLNENIFYGYFLSVGARFTL